MVFTTKMMLPHKNSLLCINTPKQGSVQDRTAASTLDRLAMSKFTLARLCDYQILKQPVFLVLFYPRTWLSAHIYALFTLEFEIMYANSPAKSQASAYIKTPSSCPECSTALSLCDGARAASDLRELSAEAAQGTRASHSCSTFPQRSPQHIFRLLSPIKSRWRGKAVLVPTSSRPGKVQKF